eukprot:gene15462-20949_t
MGSQPRSVHSTYEVVLSERDLTSSVWKHPWLADVEVNWHAACFHNCRMAVVARGKGMCSHGATLHVSGVMRLLHHFMKAHMYLIWYPQVADQNTAAACCILSSPLYTPLSKRETPGPASYSWNVQPSRKSPLTKSMGLPPNERTAAWTARWYERSLSQTIADHTPSPAAIPNPTLTLKIQPKKKLTFPKVKRFSYAFNINCSNYGPTGFRDRTSQGFTYGPGPAGNSLYEGEIGNDLIPKWDSRRGVSSGATVQCSSPARTVFSKTPRFASKPPSLDNRSQAI